MRARDRGALDDRLTVRETMAKLADVDRSLIPDVRPTVDALVERIAGLAQSLHRIDADHHQATVAELDARLARARQDATAAGGESADQARTVQLLERQRASLADLLERTRPAFLGTLPDEGDAIVVAHRMVNAVLLAELIGLPLEDAALVQQDPGAISIIAREPSGGLAVQMLNVSPLDPLRALAVTTRG